MSKRAVPDVRLGVVPRQQRGADKRQRLLEAAMREFAKVGVADARVEVIVQDAGVGWGTFFHYFPRKEDVLLLAAIEHQRVIEAAMDRAAADERASTRDVVLAAYDATARSRHPQRLHVAMIRELLTSPTRFGQMLPVGMEPLQQRIARLLEIGQTRGEVRRDLDAGHMAGVLQVAILSTVARVGMPGAVGLSSRTELRSLVRSTFVVLWAGIEREAEGRPVLPD